MKYQKGDKVKVVGEIQSVFRIPKGAIGTVLGPGSAVAVTGKQAYIYRVEVEDADRILYLFEDEIEKETI